jgi:hypothetical protein
MTAIGAATTASQPAQRGKALLLSAIVRRGADRRQIAVLARVDHLGQEAAVPTNARSSSAADKCSVKRLVKRAAGAPSTMS